MTNVCCQPLTAKNLYEKTNTLFTMQTALLRPSDSSFSDIVLYFQLGSPAVICSLVDSVNVSKLGLGCC